MDIARLREQLSKLLPGTPAAGLLAIRAPGRVNLIGEHTDYNGGLVCPMAIDRSTLVLAAPRAEPVIRLHSLLAKETVEFSVEREVPKAGPAWSLYARGAAEAVRRLTAEHAQRGPFPPLPAGHGAQIRVLRGFDAVVDSDVPLGGGLSSSASFEVATALTLLTANGASMNPAELALACQWAEHTYPGMPCGIMDQFISVMGQAGHAMLLDCRDQSIRHVPMGGGGGSGVRVVISNSNVHHELVAGEYKARRDQCEAAVRHFQQKHPAVALLRDVTPMMLEEGRVNMDPLIYRRARHVVTEIARVIAFAAGLEKHDYRRCGELMYASHASLRDDYEVSCPELDALVEIARGVPGVFGARMTGGGFGGCIVALCPGDTVETLTRAIDQEYPRRTAGKKATTFATTASAGAHVC